MVGTAHTVTRRGRADNAVPARRPSRVTVVTFAERAPVRPRSWEKRRGDDSDDFARSVAPQQIRHKTPRRTGFKMSETAVSTRLASMDNLKVALVAGVIVGHVTMAWSGSGGWVFEEPPVREPLQGLLLMASIVGVLFAMPLFFLVAGLFTPASLERKGLRRFAIDRTVRLLTPVVFFVVVLTPPIEYVDPDNTGWSGDFWTFLPVVCWGHLPPAPGPTWFLGVLLGFSLLYAVLRAKWPRRSTVAGPLRSWHVVFAAVVVALSSYPLRLAVPLGEERWHVAVGQAPAWMVGFAIGVLGAERGWFHPLEPTLARRVRRVAWAALSVCAVVVGVVVALGVDPAVFAGGGTWQSIVLAVLEGAIMVTVSLWLVDVFDRRFTHQGPLGRELSRAAYAAFLVHQIVLVALVLMSRVLPWPPELKYVAVCALGLLGSFGLGAAIVRLPGVSRVL